MDQDLPPEHAVVYEPRGRDRPSERRLTFSSVFIGSGSPAIGYAQLATAMEHVIGAALCCDATFAQWAARAKIPCLESAEELSSFLQAQPVDWIFSVANPFSLPPDVLRRARQGAFKYVVGAHHFAGRFNVDQDCRLLILSDKQVRSITAVHEFLAPLENLWRKRLEQFRQLHLPFLSSSAAAAPVLWQSSSWSSLNALAELSPQERSEYLLTAWLIYLARVTGEEKLQLGWKRAGLELEVGSKLIEALIASVVPMDICIDLTHDFEEARKAVAAEVAQLRAHASFARDLIERCPTLRDVKELRSPHPWPVGIAITSASGSVTDDLSTSDESGPPLCGNLLTFEVCSLDGRFRWHFDAERLAPPPMDRMTQHLQSLLRSVMDDRGQAVGRIDILPTEERTYLLEESDQTSTLVPFERHTH
ncbi:hypothetical protein [Bradyrhizobium centrosematis]|uniref:hypothetical protein n=1 Tax=Bradyrhizobium centrosematis TaxID=1300039 RepID=UPI00388FDB85